MKDTVDAYIEFLHAQCKSAKFSGYAANAFILPELGETKVNDLTKDQIEKWHHNRRLG